MNHSTEFWLFGYGSLIWKPPPDYDRRVPGYIKGKLLDTCLMDILGDGAFF
ncbi:unnamed protein product [Tuber melanosporum]|uniref:(Perigord truffle) hypothetical protein n=1 Tax=Tuber melanosporum (strain Mel28) TaxID=656061 RepID=D5GIW9_TUBMM|nr:uncharacterized protein GSTUM_00008721001 [Tuber melanosporum]CAZ84462.1 unnamed protein product [Tuber melanosporum]